MPKDMWVIDKKKKPCATNLFHAGGPYESIHDRRIVDIIYVALQSSVFCSVCYQ